MNHTLPDDPHAVFDDLFALHLWNLLDAYQFATMADLRDFLLWRIDFIGDDPMAVWRAAEPAMEARILAVKDRFDRGECPDSADPVKPR